MNVRFNGPYVPSRATEFSSGFDLRAFFEDKTSKVIAPGERMLIPTGIFIEIPAGFEGQIRPRSGLALKKGVTVLNAPGTIDADYRNEIGVILINHGKEYFSIEHLDRVAQLVIAPVDHSISLEPINGDERLSESERGLGGFGHSGVR
jgi:dUTP pyrophosphatase